jgi:hypothetical protein
MHIDNMDSAPFASLWEWFWREFGSFIYNLEVNQTSSTIVTLQIDADLMRHIMCACVFLRDMERKDLRAQFPAVQEAYENYLMMVALHNNLDTSST